MTFICIKLITCQKVVIFLDCILLTINKREIFIGAKLKKLYRSLLFALTMFNNSKLDIMEANEIKKGLKFKYIMLSGKGRYHNAIFEVKSTGNKNTVLEMIPYSITSPAFKIDTNDFILAIKENFYVPVI